MKIIGLAFAFALSALVADPAFAACDPACEKPQVCRYEAAGDHYYCADPASAKGKLKGETMQPGRRATPGDRALTPGGSQRKVGER